MYRVEVELAAAAGRRYEVLVPVPLPRIATDCLLERVSAARWAVVSDSTVGPLYAEPLVEELRERGEVVDLAVFPAGEEAKTRDTVADVQDRLVESGIGRDGCIIAVGGGVVGDVAGFVAATLFRGIVYVQVPTTLLAMVDSSVGGKTGVDTPAGKNLVGAFHHPACVLIDTLTLGSLPQPELAAGLAEIIKYGVILDADLFSRLDESVDATGAASWHEELDEIIARCCTLKARVIAADEREADYRQILNFGHTVAHGIEQTMGYRVRHGEAVAIGMVAEARLAHRLVDAPAELAGRIADLCARAGLPVRLPRGCPPEAVVSAAAKDKKARAGRLRCALPTDLGAMARGADGYGIVVDPEQLLAALR
jgi:3-dehydroquinate synthase